MLPLQGHGRVGSIGRSVEPDHHWPLARAHTRTLLNEGTLSFILLALPWIRPVCYQRLTSPLCCVCVVGTKSDLLSLVGGTTTASKKRGGRIG
jgi:hypothetical protein